MYNSAAGSGVLLIGRLGCLCAMPVVQHIGCRYAGIDHVQHTQLEYSVWIDLHVIMLVLFAHQFCV